MKLNTNVIHEIQCSYRFKSISGQLCLVIQQPKSRDNTTLSNEDLSSPDPLKTAPPCPTRTFPSLILLKETTIWQHPRPHSIPARTPMYLPTRQELAGWTYVYWKCWDSNGWILSVHPTSDNTVDTTNSSILESFATQTQLVLTCMAPNHQQQPMLWPALTMTPTTVGKRSSMFCGN